MNIPGVSFERQRNIKRSEVMRVRQQHKLLLHTYKCQQAKARAQANGQAVYRCHVTGCQKMVGVLKHMMSCPADKKCSWSSSCSSLRKMMRRYSQCTEEYCPSCCHKSEWQLSISEDQRKLIVELLVQMIPSSDSFDMGFRSSYPDETYLKIMERHTYGTAKSRDEYFRTLAAGKWTIEMDVLDVEREREKRLDSILSGPEQPDNLGEL